MVTQTHKKSCLKGSSGFTLIETAIAMMVVGVIIAGFAVPFSLYLKNKEAKETTTNLTVASSALTGFLGIQGRYPCPARTDLPRTDVDYGRETNCADASVAPGTCANGICIEQNTRTITDPITGAPVNITQRVRVGNLPFRQMNISEDDTFDGYGMRYKYAVTEELAVATTFNPGRGGIEILDENDNSILTPPMSGHFIIISSGPDRKGGLTRDNAQIACDAGERQTENCNVTANAVYRKGTSSDTPGANKFDDQVSYFSSDEIPLWRISTDPDATRFDIEQIPASGGVQFMNGADPSPTATLPTDTLNIANGIKASGDAGNNGQVRVDQLCSNPTGGTPPPPTCFQTAIVAGDSNVLECPVGFVAREVDGGALGCVPINNLSFQCSGATPYVTGVNADGTLICAGAPVVSCPATTRSVCGTNDMVIPINGVEGQYTSVITSNTGFCRRDTYRCQAGSWRSTNPRGSCVQYQYQNGASCGQGNTGTQDLRREYNCSTLSWGPWLPNPGGTNTCACDISATRNRSISCPAGFSGTAYMPQTRTCSPPGWVDAPPAVYSCTCTPEGPYGTTTACPGAMEGTRTIYRYQYVCSPGRTYQALPDIEDCTCNTARTWVTTRYCPAGYTGTITDTRRVVMPGCTWGAPETVEDCTPVPPPVCQWSNNDTTSQIDDAPYSGNQKGATGCSCGATGRCYERVGPGQYKNYNSCVCGS